MNERQKAIQAHLEARDDGLDGERGSFAPAEPYRCPVCDQSPQVPTTQGVSEAVLIVAILAAFASGGAAIGIAMTNGWIR